MTSIPRSVLESNPDLLPLLTSANLWWGPTGCVIAGVAGVGSEERYYVEFCNIHGNAGTEGNWAKDAEIGELRKIFETWDPRLGMLLEHVENAKVWRLAYTQSGLDWVSQSGKVVLIGDAAHAMLPHAMAVSEPRVPLKVDSNQGATGGEKMLLISDRVPRLQSKTGPH